VKNDRDGSTNCVISEGAIGYVRRAGLVDSTETLTDCVVIESVRKLMALGLSAKEIEDLDIRQPTLQAICELARLDDEGSGGPAKVTDALEATLKVIGDQVRDLDMEIEMLKMRKSALKRRTLALQKLTKSLGTGHNPLA
jgi:hypothetical protein